jgi:hypothetical protein
MNMTQLHFLFSSKLSRIVSFFIFLFLSSTQSFATHADGADLTYSCIGTNQYQLSLTVYRDCNGINIPGHQTISWLGTCGSGSITLTRTSIVDITPLAPFAASPCNGGSGLGREAHTYSAAVTLFPGCTDITFSHRLCCRINFASTITGSDPLYVDAFIDSVGSCNNSPFFLNHPLFFNCTNNSILYNPGVVDFDGDSLVFSLVDALQSDSSTVNYVSGYDGVNFLGTNVPVNIDPNTGILTFTPTNVEVAYVCIRIDEYRNGVHIGYIKRDIVYHVIACTNTPPILSGIDSTTIDSVSVCVGNSICFDIYAVDTNLTDSVVLSLNSALPNSSFTTYPGPTDNLMMGTFCWTPTLADTGLHQIYIIANDHSLPMCGHSYRTYQINVHSNSNDPINAGPDLNVCQGDSILLSATTTSPDVISYLWSSTTGTILAPDSFSTLAISPTPAMYQVLATYADGCNHLDSLAVNISSISLSIANITDASVLFPPNGSATVLAQGNTGGYTYDWGANAGHQTSATAINLTTDTFCVLVSDSLGCSDSICVFVPFYSPVQIASSSEEILLFPNPTQEKLFLNCSKLIGNKSIKIYDAVGQLVYSKITSREQVEVSVKNWSEGIYILKLALDNKEPFSKKIIVRR